MSDINLVISVDGMDGSRVSDCWKPHHPVPRVGEKILYAYFHYAGDGHTVLSSELLDVKVVSVTHALHNNFPAIWVHTKRLSFLDRILRR